MTNTSPPVVFRNLVILSNSVDDRVIHKNDPPGDIRAFDARTGRQVWSFRTIPQQGEFGNETWKNDSWKNIGHANAWAPITLDEQRGLVYFATGTPSNDYYGGERLGDNLFAETLISSGCPDRQAAVALPTRSSRAVGLRLADAAQSGHLECQRPSRRCRCPTHQDGIRLHVRSGHGKADLADRGTSGAEERCSR